MGLKGKIEAIIYAAEEPVSLEQIALLVKEPALQELAEERSRAEAAAAEQPYETDIADLVTAGAPDDALRTGTVVEAQFASAADAQAERAEQLQPASSVDAPEATATTVPSQEAGPNQLDAAEVNVAPDAVTSSAEPTLSGESQLKAPVEPSDVAAGAEQPVAEASEKAKANVASKRRAKGEIPPEVRAKVRSVIEELVADYSNPDRGMEIRQIAGGYRMTTKPEHHDVVKAFAKSLKPPLRLSLPALETLAVIAYKQPVTAPEVCEIRGVDSQGVVATLLDRKLITTAGRKAVIGRPILYKTTKEFLMRFGLNEISELPSMEEFEKLAQEAGQVDMFQVDEENGTPASIESTETVAPEESVSSRTGSGETEAVAEQAEALPVADRTQQPSGSSEDTADRHPAQSEEPVH